jgi:FkbM family methyltransferase
MSLVSIARWLGNGLYSSAFPIYRPLYGVFKSYTDSRERELLSQQISPGSVVVDAGANIGIYSQFFAKCVGPSGDVHSFEPDPKNFARLSAAVSSLSNVHANQFAVSNKTGNATLYVSDNLNVDHRAYPTTGEARRTLSIQSLRLDDYFKPGDRVDLIKMDIQGFELHALRGAQRVLDDNPDIRLLFEFWPYGLKQAGSSAEALLFFLRERGFSILFPRGTSLMPYDNFPINDDAGTYLNLFAKKTDR